jgi:ketosteroid isomerase-like protein
MSKHIFFSPSDATDRLAIRELIEAYAHCADRRDAKGQMSLFTADAHFVVYMTAKDPTPSQAFRSREALAPVFAELNKYEATSSAGNTQTDPRDEHRQHLLERRGSMESC